MLFGSEDKDIFERMNFMISKAPEIMLNPLDVLTFMMLTKFKLNPYTNKYRKSMAELSTSIIEEFERIQKLDVIKKNTFLGGMVNHNKANPQQQLTESEIVGNLFLFIAASLDTVRIASGWALHFLSKDKELQNAILEESLTFHKRGDPISYQQIENSPILNAFVKESLRLGSPSYVQDLREIKKKSKVGELSFIKGDNVATAVMLNHYKEKDYPEPFKFDSKRFASDSMKSKRQNYAPFGYGARSCVGKNLAEANLRIIILKMVENFEMDFEPSDKFFSTEEELLPFYNLSKVTLRLKPRH